MFKLESLFFFECTPKKKTEENYMFGRCFQKIDGEKTNIQKVALRKYPKEDKVECERDLEVLKRPEQLHENFIRFVHIFEDRSSIYIALERCRCSVADLFFQENDDEDEKKGENEYLKLVRLKLGAKQILRESAEGLVYLHGLDFLHRNIKPSNFLIAEYGNIYKIKITDFKRRKNLHDESSKNSQSNWSLGWTPPEGFSINASLCESADVFPFGLYIYFVLFGGSHPFGDDYLTHKARIEQANDEVYRDWDEKIYEDLESKYDTCWRGGIDFNEKTLKEDVTKAIRLIQSMIKFKQIDRIHMNNVLQHPFFQPDCCYPLYGNDMKPGLLLLFNQGKFVDKDMDISKQETNKEKLCSTFTQLGFDIEVYSNLFAKEIERKISAKSEDIQLKNYNCLIVCILSHGSRGFISGSDGEQVSIHQLQYAFNSQRCPSLHNKPKIFIIQACRAPEKKDVWDRISELFSKSGNSSDESIQEIQHLLSKPVSIECKKSAINLSPVNDFFCAMSSVDGSLSYSGEETDFIPLLCSVLNKETGEHNLENVFQRVQDEMSRILFTETGKASDTTRVQTPERTSSLRKHVVFKKQETNANILHEEDFSKNDQFIKQRK